MAATIVWISLAKWSQLGARRIRFAAAGGLIGLVALSRLALGVHYLIDVIASIGFGIGYIAFAAWLTNRDLTIMFSSAAGLGLVSFFVTEASPDGQLALVGTVGAALAWWILERFNL